MAIKKAVPMSRLIISVDIFSVSSVRILNMAFVYSSKVLADLFFISIIQFRFRRNQASAVHEAFLDACLQP